MDIKNILNRLVEFLDSEAIYIMSKNNKLKFKDSLNFIEAHVISIDKNEIPENLKDSAIVIKACTHILKILTTELILTDSLKQFCEDFCFLVQNWNNNTINDSELSNEINFILGRCNKMSTFFETRDILSYLSAKLEDQLNWRPPSFELSSHYYNLIREK